MEDMKALKGVVIGMGVLVVAGMVLLVYGLYYKAAHPDFKLLKDGDRAEDALSPIPTDFGNVEIPLPPGCRLLDVKPDGGRLYAISDCSRVVVLDKITGTVLGTISAAK